MDSCEAPDEFLGHSVSEVFLRWVSRHVFQWQDRQGLDDRLLYPQGNVAPAQRENESEKCQHDGSAHQSVQLPGMKSLLGRHDRMTRSIRVCVLEKRTDL